MFHTASLGLLPGEVGEGAKGQVSGLFLIPTSSRITLHLTLLSFKVSTFKLYFEEKLQTTILRFDLRPASTGSPLAFCVLG